MKEALKKTQVSLTSEAVIIEITAGDFFKVIELPLCVVPAKLALEMAGAIAGNGMLPKPSDDAKE